MLKLFLSEIIIFSLFFLPSSPADRIFANTDIFHSQYCFLGFHQAGTRTTTCTTASPQTNIINTAIALTDYSKPSNTQMRFELSVSYAADPATIFNIQIIYQNPVAGMKMGVFLVVIKAQPDGSYVDLINFRWPGGTFLDNQNDVYKTDTKQFDVSQHTIFTAGTAGLIHLPFCTYSKILVRSNQILKWQIIPTFADPMLNVQVIFGNANKVEGFGGFILLFNPAEVTAGISNGQDIGYFTAEYSLSQSLTLFNVSATAPKFGPRFDEKCIFGVQQIIFNRSNTFQYTIVNTTGGNYSEYKQIRTSQAEQWGNIFCFGNNTLFCSELHTYVDLLDNKCYTAATCPLPVFTGWASTENCPMCIQQVCQQCDVSDRLKCSLCEPNTNTHLDVSVNKCVCDTNFYEVAVPIDSAAFGLWNNLTPSLDHCILNCSAVIPGCLRDDCQNQTFCTICSAASNYVLVVVSVSEQTCVLCSVRIANCQTCTDASYCAVCNDGAYMLAGTSSNSCPLCSSTVLHCTNCSDANTCTVCESGYVLNSTTNKCDCDITFNNIPNCVSCVVADKCSVCVAKYFLNSSTSICEPCSNIHPNCTDCSGQKTCIDCNSGFALDSISIVGSVTCRQCRKFIDNCTLCSSPTVCTDCDYFYGLMGIQCKICDSLVMPGCEACETSSLCLKCNTTAHMIDNVCHFCSQINLCADCKVSTINTLECTQCISGYFLSPSVPPSSECKPCFTVCNFCQDCSGPNQCTSCKSPYSLGPNGICDQCELGFKLIQGFCIKQAGCMSLYIAPDGKEICLSCLNELNFVFDTKQLKCVCNVGYKKEHGIGSLIKCIAICGDGLVSANDEYCDDGNTINEDGCDSKCQKEDNFNCSLQQPSKCILVHDVDSFEYIYALREVPQNKAKIHFKIAPAIKAFAKIKWQKMISISFYHENSVVQTELNFAYSFETNLLVVDFPYYETLEDSSMQATLKLDSTIIKSKREYFLEGIALKGRNAPLLFEQQSMLDTQGSISAISTILIVLLLLQFYAGSYTHKMIGLETIQVIQTIYFSRMIVSPKSTSLLQSINNIQYSATGYHNYQLFMNQSAVEKIQAESYDTIGAEFSGIRLQKFFLLNLNFVLLPIFVAVVSFIIKTVQKISKRKEFIENKLPEIKTEYTERQRSAQWVYDHLVFPFVMMVNMACFFSNILYFTTSGSETQSDQSKQLQVISFPFHQMMFLGTLAIYSYELFLSYEDFRKYRMSDKQRQRAPKSQIEKLDHDQNYPDRANYHPAYVLMYSLYYFSLQLSVVIGVMFKDFSYRLQLVLGVAGCYFLVICIWKPYHESVNAHNHFLKLNHGTVMIFLGICKVFLLFESLPNTFYIASMYLIMALLAAVMVGGFARIFIERAFRKRLEQSADLLKPRVCSQDKKISEKEDLGQGDKNQQLLAKEKRVRNNPYALENQLKDIAKKYSLPQSNESKLTSDEQKIVIEKIREEQIKMKSYLIHGIIEKNEGLSQDDLVAKDRQVRLDSQQKEGKRGQMSEEKSIQKLKGAPYPHYRIPDYQANIQPNDLQMTSNLTQKQIDQMWLSELKKKLRMELQTALL